MYLRMGALLSKGSSHVRKMEEDVVSSTVTLNGLSGTPT